MKYELVKPNNNNLENQLKELFGFMLDSNSIQEPTNPQYFVEGWHSGAIKIFTARDNDKLVALKVVLVIKDPLAQLKYHLITALDAGEKNTAFEEYVDNALVVYQ